MFCKGLAHVGGSRDGAQHSQAHIENALHDITELPDVSLLPLSLSVRPCLQQKRFSYMNGECCGNITSSSFPPSFPRCSDLVRHSSAAQLVSHQPPKLVLFSVKLPSLKTFLKSRSFVLLFSEVSGSATVWMRTENRFRPVGRLIHVDVNTHKNSGSKITLGASSEFRHAEKGKP